MINTRAILIGVICFLLSIGATVGYDNYRVHNRLKERTKQLLAARPTLTPSETLHIYWQSASENRISDAALFTGPTPASYWIKCIGDSYNPREGKADVGIDPNQLFEIDGDMYSFTRLLQVNRPSIDKLKITDERSYLDEAVVEFSYLDPEISRAFLKRDTEGWKLFFIDTTNLEFMRSDEYARERTICPSNDEDTTNGQF